jgi:hypothetical protein
MTARAAPGSLNLVALRSSWTVLQSYNAEAPADGYSTLPKASGPRPPPRSVPQVPVNQPADAPALPAALPRKSNTARPRRPPKLPHLNWPDARPGPWIPRREPAAIRHRPQILSRRPSTWRLRSRSRNLLTNSAFASSCTMGAAQIGLSARNHHGARTRGWASVPLAWPVTRMQMGERTVGTAGHLHARGWPYARRHGLLACGWRPVPVVWPVMHVRRGLVPASPWSTCMRVRHRTAVPMVHLHASEAPVPPCPWSTCMRVRHRTAVPMVHLHASEAPYRRHHGPLACG